MAWVPPEAVGLAAAACFVLHGACATRIAFSHHPTGEMKTWLPRLGNLLFLTAQCNIFVLAYGLLWLAEIGIPGSSQGLLYLSAHLVCGLAVYVFVNYYGLIHFHKEAYEGLKVLEAQGELLYKGDFISVPFFVRTQNYMHAPLLPLAGLPLIAIHRDRLIEGMMGTAGTSAFALCYGWCYAALCVGIRNATGLWIYPFMYDFTRVWHHVVFYAVSFGLYLAFCLGYRACAEGTRGLEAEERVAVAVVGSLVALAIAVGRGEEATGLGAWRRCEDGPSSYKPLGDGGLSAPRGAEGA